MTLSVFVLDDDIFYANLVAEMLSKEGLVVHCSNNPEEISIKMLQCFDYLILDMLMPHLDGFSIIKMISVLNRMPELILISGADKKELNSAVTWARDNGINIVGYLEKPFKKSDLMMLISSNKNHDLQNSSRVQADGNISY